MNSPIPFPRRIPFVETLGMELWRFDHGHAELRIDIRESLANSWDVAHGGVLMTMLDVAMAHAARSIHTARGTADHGMATIEMKTSFMRPAKGALRAVGTLLHHTSSTAFCEARVLGADDQLCAHATGTFKYLRPRQGVAKDST